MVLVEFRPPCGFWEALDRLGLDYVFLNPVQLIDRLIFRNLFFLLKNFEKLEIAHFSQRHGLSSNRHQLSQFRWLKLTRAKWLISIPWYSRDLWERDDLSEKMIGLDHETFMGRNGPMIIRDRVISRTMLFGTVRYSNWPYEELK